MELQQLQQSSGQTGGKTPAAKERVDFLYEVPMAKKEEYLLGKPVEAKPDESDVKKVEQLPGSTFLIGQNNLSSMANEEFNKMTNDPLMAMRAEEQKALQRLMANPVKMKQIRGAVGRQASLMADGASSSRSGERHSHHHRHHHHKKHKHERHSSKHDKHDKHERRHDKHERKHERKRRREERKQSSNRGGRPGAGSASSASSSDEEADGGSGGGGVGRHQAPPPQAPPPSGRADAPTLPRSRASRVSACNCTSRVRRWWPMAPARPPSFRPSALRVNATVTSSSRVTSASATTERSTAAAPPPPPVLRGAGPGHSRPTAVLRRRARPPHAHRRRRTLQRSAHITLTARRAEVAAVVPGR